MRGTVYRIFAEDGTLLYVGATGSYLIRLANHERDREWWEDEAHHVTLEHFASRDAALEAEPGIIEREQPKHNVQHTRRKLSEAEIRARVEAKERRRRHSEEWNERFWFPKGRLICPNCGAKPGLARRCVPVENLKCPTCGHEGLERTQREREAA